MTSATSGTSEGAQGIFSKITFLKSVRSNEKDEVCPSFVVEIFTKYLHRGGVRWPWVSVFDTDISGCINTYIKLVYLAFFGTFMLQQLSVSNVAQLRLEVVCESAHHVIVLKTLWVTLTSIPGLHKAQLWFIVFFVGQLLFYFIYLSYVFFLLFIFSRIHMIRIFLLWNIREVLFHLFYFTYSFRSVSFTYRYCSHDPTTNSELVLKFRIRRFGIGCWIR